MNWLTRIKSRINREAFQPSWIGMFVNPVYIVRNGLFQAVRSLAPGINGKLLDFGCGSKPYENLFAHCDAYIGCDIEVSGHDHRDSKVDFFFNGKTLPFIDGEFDAVVSFEVFEHVFCLPELLSEINRVTRPGGLLLVSVPFVWAEHEAPYDFARYTSFGMSHLLKEAGYDVIEIKKTSTYLHAAFQVLIAYFNQYFAPGGKLGYIFQMLFIFPLTLSACVLNAVFPKRYDLFCGSVILARKTERLIGNT